MFAEWLLQRQRNETDDDVAVVVSVVDGAQKNAANCNPEVDEDCVCTTSEQRICPHPSKRASGFTASSECKTSTVHELTVRDILWPAEFMCCTGVPKFVLVRVPKFVLVSAVKL